MSENEQVKSIVTSYRLREDTKESLQRQLKDLGLTQEQYFNKVVSLMELENVKQNSFLSKDTTIIQSNLDAILDAFISIADGSNNLIGNKDAELEALKNKYKDMLADKESSITLQKEELQQVYSNLVVLQNQNKENEDKLSIIKIDNDKQLDHLESNLRDKNLIVEEYKSKNDMLLSDLAEYKKFKIEVEQYKNLLADAQAREIDKDNIIKDNDYKINHLNESMEKLKQDNQKELESIKKENELNIKLAVAGIKEELNNKLREEQTKHNSEVETYQAKYKELLEQLEQPKKITTKPKKEDAIKK